MLTANQSWLRQVVFKAGLDASVKMSSPLPDCRVNRTLVKLIPCRYSALTQLANIIDVMLVDLFLHH